LYTGIISYKKYVEEGGHATVGIPSIWLADEYYNCTGAAVAAGRSLQKGYVPVTVIYFTV